MAWGKFSAEACMLYTAVQKLNSRGKTSEAIAVIKSFLNSAATTGPSDMSYNEYVRMAKEVRHENDA